MKYRKKPVVIEAIEYHTDDVLEAVKFVGESNCYLRPIEKEFYIETLEGDMLVSDGDYIIKGIKGEFYPCKPDIFEATYEKA